MNLAATALSGILGRINRRALTFADAPQGDPAPAPRARRRYLLYIHVPFCESLCPFCSFHRVLFRGERAHPYFAALRAEIRHYADRGFEFGEVYVGGGTPTVLPDELAATLALVRDRFPVGDISVETNPNHLTPAVLDTLAGAGVTRLSVGVQSLDDALLRRMGRYEAYGSGAQLIERLRSAQGRFPTLNVDMIFNLPGQSEASLRRDVALLSDTLRVDQASFYPLMASPVTRHRMSHEMGEVSFTREQSFYRMIRAGMAGEYRPVSAWCFSRRAGMIDEYVVDHEDYVGVGSGAFGYLDGTLTANTFSLREYQALAGAGRTGITRMRRFARREQLRYHLLMGLFGLRLPRARARARFGPGAWRELAPEVAGLRLIGAVREDGDDLVLTERGMYCWVVMMREFFSGVNRFREEMRNGLREARRSPATRAPASGELRP